MTDLQDLILDRLVGAKLGVNLPNSPLRVAAELIGDGMPIPEEEFTGSGISEAGISVVARRLGLPVLVCEAFQGALHGIDSEEDRRRFAMSVFRLIPCGGQQPKLNKLEQARIAAIVAASVHPFVCHDPNCDVPMRLTNLARSEPLSAYEYYLIRLEMKCSTERQMHPNGVCGFLTSASTPLQRLIRLTEYAVRAFENKNNSAWWVAREASFLTVSQRGVKDTVAFCVDIARRCGMAVEAV